MKIYLILGDCLEKLKELPENSVDSIVTDPPYELGFMGKSWDNTGIANDKNMWAECLRVLKPGGHLLAFSGTRTYHRMAVAIEDAGFEVRDMIEWVYGSGFPKSLNIGKAVDKLQGNEREDLGENDNQRLNKPETDIYEAGIRGKEARLTKGTSEWEGWGTALKPAHEPICMARKPLSEKTVAENVLKHGTGGINIDESRVGMSQEDKEMLDAKASTNDNGVNFDVGESKAKGTATPANNLGRFPANLIHDNSEEVRECFPETKSGWTDKDKQKSNSMFLGEMDYTGTHYSDNSGNASRFFKSIVYQAKASKSERNKGLEDFEEIEVRGGGGRVEDGYDLSDPEQVGLKEAARKYGAVKSKKANTHPTVKPIALMEYLIKMVTPKGGIVLDPFMGSGSTGVACMQNSYQFIGIELELEYMKIAEQRLKVKEIINSLK